MSDRPALLGAPRSSVVTEPPARYLGGGSSAGGPPPGPRGAGAPKPQPHRRRHRPRTLVLLVAATVTVVVVALAVAPRVRSNTDKPADRTVDTYTVRLGDTISSVALLHGTTKQAVEDANDLTDASSIEPGSQIEVPHPETPDSALPTFLAADPDKLALRHTFAVAARTYDVPVGLIESIAWQVSNWDNSRISQTGEIGIGQLDHATIEFINDELVAGPALDPEVAAENIDLLAAYVDHLLDATDGSWAATAAAYKLGLSASEAEDWDGETQNFITTVLGGVPDFEAG